MADISAKAVDEKNFTFLLRIPELGTPRAFSKNIG